MTASSFPRIVEAQAGTGARFAAYAVVQNQDDPMSKAMNELIAHSRELEQTVEEMREKIEKMEGELADQGSANAWAPSTSKRISA